MLRSPSVDDATGSSDSLGIVDEAVLCKLNSDVDIVVDSELENTKLAEDAESI